MALKQASHQKGVSFEKEDVNSLSRWLLVGTNDNKRPTVLAERFRLYNSSRNRRSFASFASDMRKFPQLRSVGMTVLAPRPLGLSF